MLSSLFEYWSNLNYCSLANQSQGLLSNPFSLARKYFSLVSDLARGTSLQPSNAVVPVVVPLGPPSTSHLDSLIKPVIHFYVGFAGRCRSYIIS